ncbi:MAG: hypothetical protein FJZ09_01010 [Candidatus Omnitrophica bacterium]|nr:hypothetical protein [Candidatus Omnitrophota bacterium]
MKKYAVYVVILALLCIAAGAIAGIAIGKRAQLKQVAEGIRERRHVAGEYLRGKFAGKKGHQMRQHLKEALFDRITEKLGLRDKQAKEVRAILEETREEVAAARDQFKGNLEAIKEKSHEKIMAVLTPAQQEKFKELLKKWRERPRFKAGAGPGASPMPPEEGPEPDDLP